LELDACRSRGKAVCRVCIEPMSGIVLDVAVYRRWQWVLVWKKKCRFRGVVRKELEVPD